MEMTWKIGNYANCWFCQIILMQMEQMLKEIEFII